MVINICYYMRLRFIYPPLEQPKVALLSVVIYIILQIRTTKGGSIKPHELLSDAYCKVDSTFCKTTLGPVKSGSNNQLALLFKVIYIILQIGTTKGGSI